MGGRWWLEGKTRGHVEDGAGDGGRGHERSHGDIEARPRPRPHRQRKARSPFWPRAARYGVRRVTVLPVEDVPINEGFAGALPAARWSTVIASERLLPMAREICGRSIRNGSGPAQMAWPRRRCGAHPIGRRVRHRKNTILAVITRLPASIHETDHPLRTT